MESLPDEIIQHILSDSNLNIADVVRFSSVSYKFRERVISNQSLWKVKYFQRWPKSDFEVVCEDWYNECISRVLFEKQAQQLLSTMSSMFINFDKNKIGSSQLDFVVPVVNSHTYGYYYIRDFLIVINSLPLVQSLTDKYYGNIIMKHLHKNHSKKVWKDLMELSEVEQTLEKGAIFVAFWFLEFERGLWGKITSELDDIANKVKEYLLHNFPHHPLNHTSEETQSKWKKENICGNFFRAEDCESIISAINHVLVENLKFCISYDFNDLYVGHSRIDCALLERNADPYVFAVIYESVARRLGVKIEILEYSDDCLIRCKMDYSVSDSPSLYIKQCKNGDFANFQCIKKFEFDDLNIPCNMLKVAQRAASNIHSRNLGDHYFSLRDVLELKLVIRPLSLDCYQQLSQTYMMYNLDARELICKLKDIQSQISDVESREFKSLMRSLELHQRIWKQNHSNLKQQAKVVQNRVKGVEFAVGMIVRDKFWEIVGVIHGWSVDHGASKDVPKVSYKVLVEDGRYQASSQENLQILHSPPFISHPSIGRFFDEFCMTYYKANKELQAQYPEDMDALQNILKKDRLN